MRPQAMSGFLYVGWLSAFLCFFPSSMVILAGGVWLNMAWQDQIYE
jgi:hypothetical protein